MTARQHKFADEYIKCGNATEAYIRAYPSVRSDAGAGVSASRLLKNVKIQEYICKVNGEMANIRIADTKEVKEFWTACMRDKKEKMSDRLKAAGFIARADGFIARANGVFLDKPSTKSVTIVEIVEDIPME